MPELPDVEANAIELRAHALDREIARVALHDPQRLRGSNPADLEAALTGYAFEAVARHGKMLFVKVSCGWHLVVHFGMTGHLTRLDDGAREPAHCRLHLLFRDGGGLAFTDQRRLGWVELTDDPAHYLRSQDLGPDVLALEAETFARRIGGKRGQLKTALMDQSVVAGLGNVWADEVLFQTGLRPDVKAHEQKPEVLRTLHATIRKVLPVAAEHGADLARLPASFLTPQRGQEHPTCPNCGHALETPKIAGRTAYLCPVCQASR
ncbi:Fpg/Nei family DNA glycosylase [Rhodovibrio salinarum]|uniref:Fpg/Nei family DNA glycosylase n=1 Tax=Rhodovibrio salinarum TaxID=1087 RepID=A0A934QKF2_9PROT|nr:DNA-formamidopyrimidine glycosylase family protein [Rhodovibrio salinarum]MBK1698165.1 Fpg/Nei family DNA glycosylase [Rhodovibrio salinarum]